MALFEDEERSATARALGEVRILTIDKKNFLRRVHQDPSIAYRLVQTLIDRIQNLNNQILTLIPNSEPAQGTIRLKKSQLPPK